MPRQWAVSLNVRSSRWPVANSTIRVIEQLSAWMNANGRDRRPGGRARRSRRRGARPRRCRRGRSRRASCRGRRRRARRATPCLGARDDVPALLHQRLHRDRVALVHAAAVLAALPLAEVDLAQVLDHLRPEAGRGASGSAVWWVRWSGVTKSARSGSPCRRSATRMPARGPRARAAGRRGPRPARRSRPARGRPRRRGGSRSARWRRAGRRTPAGGRSRLIGARIVLRASEGFPWTAPMSGTSTAPTP